ncbi:hypothetical protein BP00DRAFT_195858 [Aspergillus indologenus CBS 114.80]|uniref:Uncharacterized protein n=1 Tax=Aspergillus indologenus CBS 114.80 TaxID=1450541 RepID=A0A2V5JB71_9EURO|nr:hypothetical protein BP00DRAFT_195858 [Aspergillus indologenus CBS 114.80]
MAIVCSPHHDQADSKSTSIITRPAPSEIFICTQDISPHHDLHYSVVTTSLAQVAPSPGQLRQASRASSKQATILLALVR